MAGNLGWNGDMSQPITALDEHTRIDALSPEDARALSSALGEKADVSVFVDGTVYTLPPAATEAVVAMLRRLAQGDGIELASTKAWLNTSQAARRAGVSPTYLRNLATAGDIPVVYRGTHRRFLSSAILDWVASREAQRIAQSQVHSEAEAEPTAE